MPRDEIRPAETIVQQSFSMGISAAERRKELDNQVRAFIERGGKIDDLDSGQTTSSEYTFNNQSQGQADRARENNRKQCVKASMKSKFNPTEFESVYRSDANPKKSVFIVGEYISKQYDRCDKAVNGRDFYRRKLES